MGKDRWEGERTCDELQIAWDYAFIIARGVMLRNECAVAAVVKEKQVSGIGTANHSEKSRTNVFTSGFRICLVCVHKEMNVFSGKAEAMNGRVLRPQSIIYASMEF